MWYGTEKGYVQDVGSIVSALDSADARKWSHCFLPHKYPEEFLEFSSSCDNLIIASFVLNLQ